MTHDAATPAIDQEAFRFGTDGTETGHGWIDAQSIDVSIGSGQTVDVDATFLIRIRAAETGGASLANVDLELQYNKGGAGWNNVTTSSSNIIAVNSANLTEGDNTTERLTGGTATFQGTNAGVSEDGTAGGNNLDFGANEYTEVLYAIQVVNADVADADTIDLRLTRDGGTVMDNDATSDKPRITVVKANTASGTPQASTATTSGTGSVRVDAAGTPQAATATTSGTGSVTVRTTSSALQATTATAAGTGSFTAVIATGTPQAATATLSSSTGSVIVGATGTPQAGVATATGAGSTLIRTSPSLQADTATTVGQASISAINATGSPQADTATLSSTGSVIVRATGSLQAAVADITYSGLVIVSGNGSPQASTSLVSGSGSVLLNFSATLVATTATTSGSGKIVVPGGSPTIRRAGFMKNLGSMLTIS